MDVLRRAPLAFKSMLAVAPIGLSYWGYSKILERQKFIDSEETRLAKFERDRNAFGIEKINQAREGIGCSVIRHFREYYAIKDFRSLFDNLIFFRCLKIIIK